MRDNRQIFATPMPLVFSLRSLQSRFRELTQIADEIDAEYSHDEDAADVSTLAVDSD